MFLGCSGRQLASGRIWCTCDLNKRRNRERICILCIVMVSGEQRLLVKERLLIKEQVLPTGSLLCLVQSYLLYAGFQETLLALEEAGVLSKVKPVDISASETKTANTDALEADGTLGNSSLTVDSRSVVP